MSFLAPLLLFGLPLALLPVIIHLIHLLRRRQVKWAAMMFLLAAQKMNQGLSKLRQYLILATNPDLPLYELAPNDLLRLVKIIK